MAGGKGGGVGGRFGGERGGCGVGESAVEVDRREAVGGGQELWPNGCFVAFGGGVEIVQQLQ